LDEIPKILDDIVILRKGTLAAEIKSYRNRIDPQREIILKIDEDNDIYEMTVNGKVYTLDNVYESEYSQLFDELNMSIECV